MIAKNGFKWAKKQPPKKKESDVRFQRNKKQFPLKDSNKQQLIRNSHIEYNLESARGRPTRETSLDISQISRNISRYRDSQSKQRESHIGRTPSIPLRRQLKEHPIKKPIRRQKKKEGPVGHRRKPDRPNPKRAKAGPRKGRMPRLMGKSSRFLEARKSDLSGTRRRPIKSTKKIPRKKLDEFIHALDFDQLETRKQIPKSQKLLLAQKGSFASFV